MPCVHVPARPALHEQAYVSPTPVTCTTPPAIAVRIDSAKGTFCATAPGNVCPCRKRSKGRMPIVKARQKWTIAQGDKKKLYEMRDAAVKEWKQESTQAGEGHEKGRRKAKRKAKRKGKKSTRRSKETEE